MTCSDLHHLAALAWLALLAAAGCIAVLVLIGRGARHQRRAIEEMSASRPSSHAVEIAKEFYCSPPGALIEFSVQDDPTCWDTDVEP